MKISQNAWKTTWISRIKYIYIYTGHMLIFDRVKLKSQYRKTGLVMDLVELHIQWYKRRKEALYIYI